MIIDSISSLVNYQALHYRVRQAAEFLARADLAELPAGKHDIQGADIYAIVIRAHGKQREQALLEIHDQYIDIQALLRGPEMIGWKPRATCAEPIGEYDRDKDIQFFADLPDTWPELQPGQFAMFFPEDAHAPMVSCETLHKVVIKLATAAATGKPQ